MTTIEWTDMVWNPVTGCDKVSEGCRNCYAESIAHRFWGERPFTEVRCHPERLDAPIHWTKPRRVFVNSMSDLFHEEVSQQFLTAVFSIMLECPQHRFQILTKRPERMRAFCSAYRLPPNIWLGVSCEDQTTADERIPLLLQTPSAVRWVSAEPLLGPVDLTNLSVRTDRGIEQWDVLDKREAADADPGSPNTVLDWVVIGGESGPQARPCDMTWIRAIVQQCQAATIPVFVKQLGSRPFADIPELETWPLSIMDEHGGLHLKNHKGGDPSEWPTDLRVREWPCLEGMR